MLKVLESDGSNFLEVLRRVLPIRMYKELLKVRYKCSTVSYRPIIKAKNDQSDLPTSPC